MFQGADHDLAPGDCDKGYLAEASVLCHEEEECKDEAAGLFILMIKNHAFIPQYYTPEMCREECTYDYIAGVASKK